MKDRQQPTAEEINREFTAFRDQFRSVILATSDRDGTPESSYAPCIRSDDGAYYVYLSELARHCANLLANPRASLLFIHDETQGGNPFARQRLSYQAEAREIARDSESWTQAMSRLQDEFGEIVSLLAGLGDFHLFRLQPVRGNYVRGFAKAYEITGEAMDRIRHIDPSNRS